MQNALLNGHPHPSVARFGVSGTLTEQAGCSDPNREIKMYLCALFVVLVLSKQFLALCNCMWQQRYNERAMGAPESLT